MVIILSPAVTPDYDPLPVTLTLSSLSTRQCVEVSTRFNVSLNPFNVRLTTVESPSTVSLTPGSATVTILEGMMVYLPLSCVPIAVGHECVTGFC